MAPTSGTPSPASLDVPGNDRCLVQGVVFLGIDEQKPLERTRLLGRAVYQLERRLDTKPLGGVVMRLLVVHVPKAGAVHGVRRHRVEEIVDEAPGARGVHLSGQLLMLLLMIEGPRGAGALVVGEVEEADDAHSSPQTSFIHLSQKRTVQPSSLDAMSGTLSSGMTAEQ